MNKKIECGCIWQDFCEKLYAYYKYEGYSYTNMLEIVSVLKLEFERLLKELDENSMEEKI